MVRWFAVLLVVVSFAPLPAQETDADEKHLQLLGLDTDGASLLRFLRRRVEPVEDQDKLIAVARRLNALQEIERQAAMTELLERGVKSATALRFVINDLEDSQRAERAKKCLQALEGQAGTSLTTAVLRLLTARRPEGAIDGLLAFAPFAEDANVLDAVREALTRLAMHGARADSTLVKALDDMLPLRRVLAAEALAARPNPDARAPIRRLLADPNPQVRLKVALALVRQHDAAAVPVLIDLLAEFPAEQRKPVEEALENLAGEWSPNLPIAADDPISRRIRRDAWQAWWKNTEGPALLDEFRKRTLSSGEEEQVRRLVVQLAEADFRGREQAMQQLVAFGERIRPLLRPALSDVDIERRKRADICMQRLARSSDKRLPAVAARLVALRQPAGAADVLLDYYPFTEDEAMMSEVREALAKLAFRDGAADPALVRALDDPSPHKRLLAGEALTWAYDVRAREAVRKLLKDNDPDVRLRIALALVQVGEKDAIGALIAMIPAASADACQQIGDVLLALAGEKAPTLPPEFTDATRGQHHDAWKRWWTENHAVLRPLGDQREQLYLGYTLLVQVNDNNQGRVIEVSRDGRIRWKIDDLQYPVDARLLPNHNVLVAEGAGQRVTERDRAGKVVWQFSNFKNYVTNVQRLANGNTFIATSGELIEVDRQGKDVFRIPINNSSAAFRMSAGPIAWLNNNGTTVMQDTAGKELGTFPNQRSGGWTSGIDVTPQGTILVAQPQLGKVVEFDKSGKKLWEANVPSLVSATRLPNGNTLIACYNKRVVEVNRQGREVWEYKDEWYQFRARRR